MYSNNYVSVVVGDIPSDICNLTSLVLAHFGGTSMSSLGCFPSCLSAITNYDIPDYDNYCPNDLDRIMCGIIAGVLLDSSSNSHSTWLCDSYGHLITEPCGQAGQYVWSKLTCVGGVITSLTIDDTTGMLLCHWYMLLEYRS